MSDRMCACITIGGQLHRGEAPVLLRAITEAGVSLEWGDARFAPETVEELLSVLRDDRLWLCDDKAAYGELPELEATCRELGLAYRRHGEGKYEFNPQLVDWRPGMAEPLVRMGDNNDVKTAYVPEQTVKRALKLLEENHNAEAVKILRDLCPDLPEVPRFEIV